ncbi:aldehyde dehydrogenase family protein [Herbaspirillum sp. NPDC087042]|uniref:aldehyde dehydrogenase family protein n=1 Tax=Herbaspirillum sp. NPDC087042 TaxID=3364004 RepID=UPI00382481F5
MYTTGNIIGGQLRTAERLLDSRNPANGEVMGRFPQSDAIEVAAAVAAARNAQPAWAALDLEQRRAALHRVADAIAANAEWLATLVTQEQGRPLGGVGPDQVPGSRFELWGCEAWTRATASLTLAPEVVFEDETRRDELHRKPFGVVAAIAPWNWPLMISIWQVIPAIFAGNTVVLKPSEYTSVCGLELAKVIAGALPPGVMNTVSGDGSVGALLVEDPQVNKIMFTGSGATGARIVAAAARNLTPTTMELGGNDAAIVLDDADPKAIAPGLFWGAFLNMGQTCACAKRLYVPDALHDQIVAELQAIIAATPMGDGLQPGIAMGPVQNRMQLQKVAALVDSAREDGATIVCGGRLPDGPGNFYPLTLVTDIRDGARLVDEEQFGPVLPIIRYSELEEAIANANRLDVGLGASVWSSDSARAAQIATRLQAGTVWINQHGMVHPMVPFGGVKRSGWGLEFGNEGLKSVTQPQVISLKK